MFYLFFYYLGLSVLGLVGGIVWICVRWFGVIVFCLIFGFVVLGIGLVLCRVLLLM